MAAKIVSIPLVSASLPRQQLPCGLLRRRHQRRFAIIKRVGPPTPPNCALKVEFLGSFQRFSTRTSSPSHVPSLQEIPTDRGSEQLSRGDYKRFMTRDWEGRGTFDSSSGNPPLPKQEFGAEQVVVRGRSLCCCRSSLP